MGSAAVDTDPASASTADHDGAQIVRFFGRFDCLIEPALVQHLAKSPCPEETGEAVLEAMGEVPFYLTLAAFRETEDTLRVRGVHPEDRPATTPPPTQHASPASTTTAPGTTGDDASAAPSDFQPAVEHEAKTSAPPTPPSADTSREPDAAEPGSTGAESDPLRAEHEAHRKAALAKMIQLVYDQKAKEMEVDDEHDPDADTDDRDRDGVTEDEAPQLAEWEVDWSKPITFKPRGTWRPEAAEHEARIEILQDITGESTCEGTTDDFHKFFKSRYHQLEKILRRRRELVNAQPIERVMDGGHREVVIIGMVSETRTTANGHQLIVMEDETATQACLVVNNDRTDTQLIMSAGVLVPDEVLGIVGQKAMNGDLVIVDQIIRPDIPYNSERTHAQENLAVAFLSDIHVGSDLFLEKNYVKMLQWLNGDIGNERERAMAGRIKYLVLPGDMVDGVGIYPGQEHGLKFTDIYDQYAEFGRLLQHLPDHIEVLVQPGNHDAARPNEPQPAVDNEVREKFDGVNAHFIGNPALFKLNDVRVLSYHGVSLMDFATSVTGLEHHDPVPIMEEILKCRHLAPIYGMATPLAPEHRDHMVIETIPELFVTGHVHTYNQRSYRGVQMANCSTWQAQTDYQKMLNFKPDPCKMPIFDLKNLKMTQMDFGMGMDFSYSGK